MRKITVTTVPSLDPIDLTAGGRMRVEEPTIATAGPNSRSSFALLPRGTAALERRTKR